MYMGDNDPLMIKDVASHVHNGYQLTTRENLEVILIILNQLVRLSLSLNEPGS